MESAIDIILASFLLANPGAGEKTSAEMIAALAPTILTLMVSGEMLSEREATSYRGYLSAGRFEEVARRCRECDELPRVDESPFAAYPPKFWAGEMKLNSLYRDALTIRQPLDSIHAEDIADAIGETDRLHCVLNLARTAADGEAHVVQRRRALGDLRAAIGPENYYGGVMPPPIPVRHLPTR